MKTQLPIEYTNRMRELLGDEYDDFIKSYEDDNYHGLRFNMLKLKSEFCKDGHMSGTIDFTRAYSQMAKQSELRRIPWCETGYYYDEDSRPGRHPYHAAGVYYIQEPSAMIVGELASKVIEEYGDSELHVLDLCAAPGGKTSHLASAMMGHGVLWANEIVPNRAKILSQNVERMGICNCIVSSEPPQKLVDSLGTFFNLIVVDTPCSGEGMFRRDQIAIDEWTPENVRMCAERGQEILDCADRMLRMGGTLIYSTCTFAPDEDERAIENFIANHPQYRVCRVMLTPTSGSNVDADGWPDKARPEWSSDGDLALADTYRLWPHHLHGEGHYVAVLSKGDSETMADSYSGKSGRVSGNGKSAVDTAIKLYHEFEKKSLNVSLNGEFMLFGDNLYLLPTGVPSLKGMKIERPGLHLGTVKKDRFEPSHALALAIAGDEAKSVIELSSDEIWIEKYLKGESVNYSDSSCPIDGTVVCDMSGINGWTLVTVDGYSIGWGKASNGILKNHYPKGLRIQC